MTILEVQAILSWWGFPATSFKFFPASWCLCQSATARSFIAILTFFYLGTFMLELFFFVSHFHRVHPIQSSLSWLRGDGNWLFGSQLSSHHELLQRKQPFYSLDCVTLLIISFAGKGFFINTCQTHIFHITKHS